MGILKCLNKSNPEISKMIDSFGEVMTSKLLENYSNDQIPSFQEIENLYKNETLSSKTESLEYIKKDFADLLGINFNKEYSLNQVTGFKIALDKFNREHGTKHRLERTQVGQADLFKLDFVYNHNRPVNSEIQQVLFNNEKEANVKQVLNNIISNTDNPYLIELATALLNSSTEYVLGLPILLEYLQEDEGLYNPDGDVLKVSNNLVSKENAIKVALHEISHAITSKEYDNNPEFKSKIDAIWKEAKKNITGSEYRYALSSGKEFIASVFTNKNNINKRLANIKGVNNNTSNLFKKFLELLKSFFGLSNVSLLDNLLFEIEETGKEQKIREQSHGNNQYDLFDPDILSSKSDIEEPNETNVVPNSKFQKIVQSLRQSLQDRTKEMQTQYGTDRIETRQRLAVIRASLKRLTADAGIYDVLSVADKDLKEAEKVLNKNYEDIGFFDLMETKRILLFQADFDRELAEEQLTEEQEVILQKQRDKNNKLSVKFNKLITKKLSEASKDYGREITEEELMTVYKDMGILEAQTLSLDASQIPQLQFAKEIMNWRRRRTQEDLQNFAKELEALTKKYGEDEFKKIFDAGNLITQYKKEFYDKERELWSTHKAVMKDPNMTKADRSASLAGIDAFYRDEFNYSITDEQKALYEQHRKEFIENNTFVNEKGQEVVDKEAVKIWEIENSWTSMGRVEPDGSFVFERNIPKSIEIDGQTYRGSKWYRYLTKDPIDKYKDPRYENVKDLEVYQWYTDKIKEIIQKIPHEMTADMGMYDKLLNEVSLDITNNKTTPGTIWRGVEDSALDWFTVGITLQEAMGEDLKLTDEKGRPKPLVKAVKVKDVKAKDPLELLAKAYSMAVTYEHKVLVQPMYDLLLYQTEHNRSIPTNRMGIPYANKETAEGMIRASEALRYATSADLTGVTRTDESYGAANLTEHERLMLESGQESVIRKISTVKTIDTIVDYTRLTMIGLKPFTAAANLVIGVTNNYLYAARKTDFTDKDLDWALTKMFGSVFNFWTAGKLKSTNTLPKDAVKIANLGLKFNIIPENLIEDRSQYGKVSKAFDKITEIMFKMQEGGEYLIATQILLGKMHNTKVTDLAGKERILYDAYDKEGNWKTEEFGEQPEWNNLTYKNQEGVNISKLKEFRDRFDSVRSITQGDYQNPIQAKSKVWGRVLFMFRTWLPRAVYSRFGEENKYNNTKGRYISAIQSVRKGIAKEGTKGGLKVFGGAALSVLAKLSNLPLVGKYIGANPIVNWTEKEYEAYLKELGLTELDIENVRVNIREMQYIVLMFIIAMALKGLADDDKDPLLNFNINLAYRTYQDLSFFASPSSALNIIKDPIPITKLIKDATDVINAGMVLIQDPSQDIYKKGLHKGKSKFLKESGDMFIIGSAWNSTQATMDQIFNNDSYKYSSK
tara:strand:+ start:7049 stop:11266 length:4218 start_codon:yes stop_codon:yes gene_type:complete